MKHVLALLIAGAVLSGICAYAAIARPTPASSGAAMETKTRR